MRANHVPAVARGQRGVFTRAQAAEAGWSQRQVRRRVSSGDWVCVAGLGLAVAGSTRTAQGVAWAIHLTWPHAVISHATAALLHGFRLPEPYARAVPAHAITVRGSGRSATIRVWRGGVVAADRWVVDDRVPVTSPSRTAVDCLAGLPRPDAFSLLPWLVTRRIITRDHLEDGLDRYRRRAGFAQLRELFDLTRGGALSPAEDLCHDVLARSGIRGWAANVRITDEAGIICVGDVVFEHERLVVEVDGWSSHGDRPAFERDRRTQTRLAGAGWLVVRVTWTELTESPGNFVRHLRQALARRTPAASG